MNHALSRACVYVGPPGFVVHRYYDPATGRYLQSDPLDVDVNPYAYAGGNPLSFVDPEGTCIARVGTDAYLIGGAVASLLSGGTLPAAALAAYGIYSASSDVYDALTKQMSFEDAMGGLLTNYVIGRALNGAGAALRWAKGRLGGLLSEGGAGAAGLVGGGGKAAYRAGGRAGGAGASGGGASGRASLKIDRQRLAGHVDGTPDFRNRTRWEPDPARPGRFQQPGQKLTSSFTGKKCAEAYTRLAWERGVPTKNPDIKIMKFQHTVGFGPNGGAQREVRVSRNPSTGAIHATPWGQEYW